MRSLETKIPAPVVAAATGACSFRVSRNPMYLSLLLLLVAYAVRLDSPVPWLGPIAFVGYVNRFQIGPEERALQAKFGEACLRYRARTRRWL